jgi:hypothetical protein
MCNISSHGYERLRRGYSKPPPAHMLARHNYGEVLLERLKGQHIPEAGPCQEIFTERNSGTAC